MFDLPTDTKTARKRASSFRKFLLEDGFDMMQFSVYSRHVPTLENAEVHIGRVEKKIPPEGEIRVITLTDKQFEKMRTFLGKIRVPNESAPKQLQFF